MSVAGRSSRGRSVPLARLGLADTINASWLCSAVNLRPTRSRVCVSGTAVSAGVASRSSASPVLQRPWVLSCISLGSNSVRTSNA